MATKYIFITGGVISTLGKGITSASIAALLQAKGYRVTCVKCDAYVNIDAGTMNPTEHGEVFVTSDGVETDQDVGSYERFLNRRLSKLNYLTTGQIYQKVIERERNLEYGGKCVEVVPHVPEEIIRRLKQAAVADKAEVVLAEIGGTVGEYQNVLFLEADRLLKRESPGNVINVHVSYLPIPATVGEMKTKPVQYSIRTLQSTGIQPEFVVGRSSLPLDERRKEKIAVFGNVDIKNIISDPDVSSIYQVPLIFEEQAFAERIIKLLGLPKRGKPTGARLSDWQKLVKKIAEVSEPVKIGIVGKYFDTGDFVLEDSYISIIEAVKHASWSLSRKPEIQWIDSHEFEVSPANLKKLDGYDAIIVPGGFGSRGVEGKIKAIEYVREHKIPYLGLCYGMQLAVIEFARNVLHLPKANTEENDRQTPDPVIHILPEQKKLLAKHDYGATMRLGAYDCTLKKSSSVYKLYGSEKISERHRHRYEFNNDYRAKIEQAGLKVVGVNTERDLVEIVELEGHPFFVGVQFHPEFESRPLAPHPLFVGLIRAGIKS
ncbi:MAG: CTP synthase [Candidatus Jacksonbacteria bacterium RIFOXYC2_FULL_44_29]|nr:MAG: CTP synthetase [Parcubacteria group bacterium GW2011_GWC2_44_22]OGY75209.1 MAG: CTP synthase [Candidatus Jacksonbacteria bacterium RIFOXYA2_FULL_43_12]OGY75886.1 MAG: CTP synthase [Candidatus Jacksonbacteria bacterium RIFOXYB2_FULL_44_15]OGY77659.1 MAG: CTP synthase [Candidatus Jacksonbacteria bacterium RIFOXYC2_FULL_44_29]OGY79546.1 MAG: CTP synthase [Candidatus Jacksonbacteria bacterium RIFOXYD2_FULL_43_21]HBH46448.1 CTP synthase [Candidatus Jacksonbacteria bacterium]